MNKLLQNTILTVAGAGALVGIGQAPLPNTQVSDELKLVVQKEQIVGFDDIDNGKVTYAYKTDKVVPQMENEIIELRKDNEVTILKEVKKLKVKGKEIESKVYSNLLFGYPQFIKEGEQWIDLDYAETTKEAYEKQIGPQKVIDLITSSIIGDAFATTTEFITSGTTWSASTDGSNITVECIGAGGAGGSQVAGGSGGGGGGGEYASSSVAYTSGSTVSGIQVGVNQDTLWNTNVIIAKKGTTGQTHAEGGAGGAGGTGGIGTIKYNGGTGGSSIGNDKGGGGGGGAGGKNAAGNNGVDGGLGGTASNGGAGGQGDGTYGGTGGLGAIIGSRAATDGSIGQEYDSTHGSGGGGGGGNYGYNAGSGGLYGAGGGGAGEGKSAGSGKQGLIVVTYTAPTPSTGNFFMLF